MDSHHYCMSMLACQYNQPRRPGDLDLLILKGVSESRVTWATSVPILVFLGLSDLELGSMYATDRQRDRRQTKSSLNASALWGRGHNNRADSWNRTAMWSGVWLVVSAFSWTVCPLTTVISGCSCVSPVPPGRKLSQRQQHLRECNTAFCAKQHSRLSFCLMEVTQTSS